MPAGFSLGVNSFFGASCACLGDLNGDGMPDLAVGAREVSDGAYQAGAVYILFLTTTGTAASFQKLSPLYGAPAGFALDDGDKFGWSVGALGDLDGDGVADLAIGSNLDDDGGSNCGAVYIFFLTTAGTATSFQKLSNSYGMPSDFLLPASSNFGVGVSSLGDLDGDGVTDLAVGAQYDGDGGTNAGAVYIIFLTTTGTGTSFQKLSNSYGMPADFSVLAQNRFGCSVSALGDLNKDGVTDLAVGQYYNDDGAGNAGAVYVIFLATSGAATSFLKLSNSYNVPSDFWLHVNAYFGISVGNLGDVNGDGLADLVVGSFGDTDGGSQAGAAYVLFLNGVAAPPVPAPSPVPSPATGAPSPVPSTPNTEAGTKVLSTGEVVAVGLWAASGVLAAGLAAVFADNQEGNKTRN